MKLNLQVLKGEHVNLIPLQENHAQALFAIEQDANDWLYMPRPCFQSLQDTIDWIAEAQALQENGVHYTYVIADAKSGELLGSTRYLNVRARDRGLEIGYTWLGKKAQRTAVNTEVKLLLLSNAFEALNMLRVELKTDARNVRSQKAIQRIGAVKEGVFRKHMVVRDGYVRDSVYFSIIDEDWPTVKAGLLNRLAQ